MVASLVADAALYPPRVRFESRFEPATATLDLWFIDLARDADAHEWALLSDDERERATRLVLASKRRQAVRARAALRRVLAGYRDVEPSELRFAYGEHGKPTLAEDGPTFNLSHSHALGLLAVVREPCELGVDIEHARPGRDFAAIAEHFFAPEEAQWLLRRLDTPAGVAGFYRIWTHKEAYLKALGTGLSFGSRGFALALPDVTDDPLQLASTTWTGANVTSPRFLSLPCPPDYAAAACLDGPSLRRRAFLAPGSSDSPILLAWADVP
jgi:4'-phosphopantetheinyl transferase